MSILFDPVQVGALKLRNRIIMAPLTRMRSFNMRCQGYMVVTHYSQRASAGLILSEETLNDVNNQTIYTSDLTGYNDYPFFNKF